MRLRNDHIIFLFTADFPDDQVTIAYGRLHISSGRENLFYLSPLRRATKYIDPEVATTSVSEDLTYPYSKTFSFGVDITF